MTKLTPARRQEFCKAVASGLSITLAAVHVGVTKQAVYQLRKHNARFRDAWDEAVETSIELLEQALYRRARTDDTVAAIFLLKARKPEVYNPLQVLRAEMLQIAKQQAQINALLNGGGGAVQPMPDQQETLTIFSLPAGRTAQPAVMALHDGSGRVTRITIDGEQVPPDQVEAVARELGLQPDPKPEAEDDAA